MLHLHTELSKRRDKRLELAARRRDYEVVNLTKRRRLDEDAVWSWWQVRFYVLVLLHLGILIARNALIPVSSRRVADYHDC